jgi:hypothetical protein
MRLPEYASGSAVLINFDGQLSADDQDLVVVAFLPAKDRERIRSGQTLYLGFGPETEAVPVPIDEVLPGVLSPVEAQLMFRLDSNTSGAVTQPSAVALARWTPAGTGLRAENYLGSIVSADVQIGSNPVISLLPVVGHYFTGLPSPASPEPRHTHPAPE